jgi:hypothetical protein
MRTIACSDIFEVSGSGCTLHPCFWNSDGSGSISTPSFNGLLLSIDFSTAMSIDLPTGDITFDENLLGGLVGSPPEDSIEFFYNVINSNGIQVSQVIKIIFSDFGGFGCSGSTIFTTNPLSPSIIPLMIGWPGPFVDDQTHYLTDLFTAAPSIWCVQALQFELHQSSSLTDFSLLTSALSADFEIANR